MSEYYSTKQFNFYQEIQSKLGKKFPFNFSSSYFSNSEAQKKLKGFILREVKNYRYPIPRLLKQTEYIETNHKFMIDDNYGIILTIDIYNNDLIIHKTYRKKIQDNHPLYNSEFITTIKPYFIIKYDECDCYKGSTRITNELIYKYIKDIKPLQKRRLLRDNIDKFNV